jgi:hypothetical protein
LLYKSAADISKDLNVSIRLAYPVYQQYEKIRQGKYLRLNKTICELINYIVKLLMKINVE